MAYSDIHKQIKYPQKTSGRYKRLDGLERLLDGTFYDHIPTPFFEERKQNGDYIRLHLRRPSVIYNLASIIVNETVGLTFGEEHWPHILVGDQDADGENPDQETQECIEYLIEQYEIGTVMRDAMTRGSVGSVAIILKRLDDGSPYYEVVDAKDIRPIYELSNPRKMEQAVRIYCVTAEELENYGYVLTEEDKRQPWWMRIDYTEKAEVWYHPLRQDRYEKLGERDSNGVLIQWVVDDERSQPNEFGFVPVVWGRNLPGKDRIDGKSTFEKVVDMCVEADYVYSQTGRGLKYTADPSIVIKDGEMSDITAQGNARKLTRDPDGNSVAGAPINVPKDGDAKLLEITGQGFAKCLEYLDKLREHALEVLGGVKADQDQGGGNATSGRALDFHSQPLVRLVGRLRPSYGRGMLIPLIRMTLRALAAGKLNLDQVFGVNPEAHIRLSWPEWAQLSTQDMLNAAQAAEVMLGGSSTKSIPVLPEEVVVRWMAKKLGEPDPTAVLAEFREYRAKMEAREEQMIDKQTESDIAVAKAKPKPKPPSK